MDELYSVRFPNPAPLRASAGGPSGLFLDVAQSFAVVALEGARPQWRAATRMYAYRLLDHDLEELLVYHWQPGPEFRGPDYPHLHISAALDAKVNAVRRRAIELDKLHVVTGQVTLAAVVGMLITEFGVAPQRHDWPQTLDRAEGLLRDRMDREA